jgi:hypothetical protein
MVDETNMCTQYWWNDTDKGEQKPLKKTLSSWYTVKTNPRSMPSDWTLASVMTDRRLHALEKNKDNKIYYRRSTNGSHICFSHFTERKHST